MSPRAAGIVLMVFSVALGAGSGTLIARPPWSIPAAIALAAATVGMGVGLLWLFRRGWADKAWPPGGSSDLPPAERTRRSFFRLGIFFLAVTPILLAGLVWAVLDHASSLTETIVMIAVTAAYGLGGVALVASSRAPAPPSPTADERPVDSAVAENGWRRIGERPRLSMILALSTPVGIPILIVVPWQLARLSSESIWFPVGAVVLVIAAVAITLAVFRNRTPTVWVNEERRVIRAGHREAAWEAIAFAELLTAPPWNLERRTLIITLRDSAGLRAPIVLRRRGALTLSVEDTALAAAAVAASVIDLPRDKDDPRGRFSRALYPSSLTKSEALAVVEHPPRAYDPLPIAVPGS